MAVTGCQAACSNTGRQHDMAKQTGLLCEEIKQAFFILHLIMVQ